MLHDTVLTVFPPQDVQRQLSSLAPEKQKLTEKLRDLTHTNTSCENSHDFALKGWMDRLIDGWTGCTNGLISASPSLNASRGWMKKICMQGQVDSWRN